MLKRTLCYALTLLMFAGTLVGLSAAPALADEPENCGSAPTPYIEWQLIEREDGSAEWVGVERPLDEVMWQVYNECVARNNLLGMQAALEALRIECEDSGGIWSGTDCIPPESGGGSGGGSGPYPPPGGVTSYSSINAYGDTIYHEWNGYDYYCWNTTGGGYGD